MIWYCQKLYFPQISFFSPFDFLPHLQTLWFFPRWGGGGELNTGLKYYVRLKNDRECWQKARKEAKMCMEREAGREEGEKEGREEGKKRG